MDIEDFQSEPPKKKLILKSRKPTDISLPGLGDLKLKPLTMGALQRISPSLNEKEFEDDIEFVKAIMVELVSSETTDTSDLVPLSPEQITIIDNTILTAFALTLIQAEGWKVEKDSEGNIPDPITTVSSFIRNQFKALVDATKNMIDNMNGVLSDSTKRLFAQNIAFSEHLKELGGVKSAFSAIKNLNTLSSFNLPSISSAINPQMKSITDSLAAFKPYTASEEFRKIAENLSSLKVPNNSFSDLNSFKDEIHFSPPLDLLKNSPVIRSADTLDELNEQFKEMAEVFRSMAAAQGNTNLMVSDALLQFENKRISDTQDIKDSLVLSSNNLRVAKISLIIAVVLGVLSLVVTIYATKVTMDGNKLASDSIKSTANDQLSNEAKAKAQIDSLNKLIDSQKITNKLLTEQLEVEKISGIKQESKKK